MSLTLSLPLHRATIQGKYDDILKLIDTNEVEIDQQDHEGTTALILACASNQLPVASLLLQKGANPNLQRHTGSGPLFFACQGGFLELVELLLRYNVPVAQSSCEGGCPLLVACQNGHLKTVERLLQHNDSTSLEAKLRDGANGLFLASQNGHLATVQFLLSRGITVDACRKDGTSALYIATQMGHIDICKVLLKAGANVNVAREDGSTPLYRAAQKGFIDIVEVLFESAHGSPSVGLSANGNSALHVAAANGDVKLCLQLIQKGADPTLPNKNGDSALSLAQTVQNPELIQVLQSSLVRQDVSTFTGNNSLVPRSYSCSIPVNGESNTVRPISMEGPSNSRSLPYVQPVGTQYNMRSYDVGGNRHPITSHQSRQNFEMNPVTSRMASSQPMLNHILTREQNQFHSQNAFSDQRMVSTQHSFTPLPSQKQFIYQQPNQPFQQRQRLPQLQQQINQQTHQQIQHQQHVHLQNQNQQLIRQQQHPPHSREVPITHTLASPLQQPSQSPHQMFLSSQMQHHPPNIRNDINGRNSNCATSPTTYRSRDLLGFYNGHY